MEEGERSGFIAVLGANVTVRWVNRRAEAQMGWRAGEDAGGTGAGWGRYSGGTRFGPGSMGAVPSNRKPGSPLEDSSEP